MIPPLFSSLTIARSSSFFVFCDIKPHEIEKSNHARGAIASAEKNNKRKEKKRIRSRSWIRRGGRKRRLNRDTNVPRDFIYRSFQSTLSTATLGSTLLYTPVRYIPGEKTSQSLSCPLSGITKKRYPPSFILILSFNKK